MPRSVIQRVHTVLPTFCPTVAQVAFLNLVNQQKADVFWRADSGRGK